VNRIASALLAASCTALIMRYGRRQAAGRTARMGAPGRRMMVARIEEQRARLNPHMLLNALNSVAVLAEEENAPRVHEATSRLARLLRLALEQTGTFTTLRCEVSFIERYIDVEQVRFGDRLRLHWEIGADCMDVCVPALLLQPLVENAVHHGISPDTGTAEITVGAARAGRHLRVWVGDRGPGLQAAQGDGRGIGITRRQLDILYAGDYSLDVAGRVGGGAEVALTMPLTTTGARR
jgi:two-component system, LytTR family, sensor kinase